MLTRGCYTRSGRSVVSARDRGVTAGQSALIKGGSKTNCNWVENPGEGHRVRPGKRFLKKNVRPPGGQGLLRILRVGDGFQEKAPHYRRGTERRQWARKSPTSLLLSSAPNYPYAIKHKKGVPYNQTDDFTHFCLKNLKATATALPALVPGHRKERRGVARELATTQRSREKGQQGCPLPRSVAPPRAPGQHP